MAVLKPFCFIFLPLSSFFVLTFLHPVSFLRISSPPFSSPFHPKMDLSVNTCGQTSISVSLCVLAFASFMTANPLSGNLCRSESLHGSFITKYSLAIKGNGAGKVRDPEYPCMDVMQKADVINFPLHSSLGLHIRGLVVLKDGRTAGRWRISDDRTGGFALSDRLGSQSSSSSLSTQVSVFAFSLSATFNNSLSGCGTCLGLLWFPPMLSSVPALT